jgi:hypothetical protein
VSTGAGGTVYSGFGGASATATASGSKSGATTTLLALGHSYGIIVVAASIFAGFALL